MTKLQKVIVTGLLLLAGYTYYYYANNKQLEGECRQIKQFAANIKECSSEECTVVIDDGSGGLNIEIAGVSPKVLKALPECEEK